MVAINGRGRKFEIEVRPDGTAVVVVSDPERPLCMQLNDLVHRLAALDEGRTYFTGRCNCYRGHSSSSGRCRVNGGFYTLPERHGICDGCWDGCGHAEEAKVER